MTTVVHSCFATSFNCQQYRYHYGAFRPGRANSRLFWREIESARGAAAASLFLEDRFPSVIAISSGRGLWRRRKIEVGSIRVNWLKKVEGEFEGGVGVARAGKERTEVLTEEEEEENKAEETKGAPLIGSMADILNLEKQFAFYGAYHSHKLNVLIHMIFVWPIFFTNAILWAYTPAIIPLPLPAGTLPLQQYMVLNVNFIITAIFALYYTALERKAGSLAAALCLSSWIGTQAIAQVWPWSTAWKFVLIAQITCWTFQFLGHGVFEGRAPALLDNLPQAFLMAPFFVLLEFLQSFLGYEPYPGFKESVEKKTEENIASWRASKVAPSDTTPLLEEGV
ncbi:hypothetical protein R1flu_002788 [Riccia fluitans]|uniref:Uncharacterized protein n=1 Tax=Riccia fluitans TaxID=41844 RepID=A0ABD1Y740_9MARC